MNSRVGVVLGTRPEIIKLAGIIRLLGDNGYVIHSEQHYDRGLSQVFFDSFRLPPPAKVLDGVGGGSRGAQFSHITAQLTAEFERDRPSVVVVQGDTNTAAAGAQSANFLDIPVVHVEAGLRSFDRAMPEEINRRLIGVVADLHCAPTETGRANLLAEGVEDSRIIVTGNTVVEATLETLPVELQRERTLAAHHLKPGSYVLATLHRPENTDVPEHLEAILMSLVGLTEEVVLPLHPRTLARIDSFGLNGLAERLRIIEPVDHPTFLALAHEAKLLISDSGGVQEECTIIKRPLVVIRNSTERPEAFTAGFARRTSPGPDLGQFLHNATTDTSWHRSLDDRPSPYGDGQASARIVAAISELTTNRVSSSVEQPVGSPR